MTVYQRKDRGGAWFFEFQAAGQRHNRQCLNADGSPARTKTEAKAAETLARAQARQEGALRASGVRPGGFMLGQAAVLYLRRKTGRDPRHLRNAQLYVDELLAWFGKDTPMAEIDDAQVEAYRDHCGRQHLKKWRGGKARRRDVEDPKAAALWKDLGRRRSARTVNRYLEALRQLFAIADRVRDPVTRRPAIDRIPEIRLHKLPRRIPRPMPDGELEARLATAPPWTREAAELARLFGLRLAEAFKIERRHVDREQRAIRFAAGDTKSGNDEHAFGGEAGWQLLERLDAQARARGQARLVTWPGHRFAQTWRGRGPRDDQGRPLEIPRSAWQPLKSIATSWRRGADRAGIQDRHRFHDVRARYVTEVAKVQQAAAQGAARHQDPATTALYIHLAASEISQAVDQATRRRPVAANGVRDPGRDSGRDSRGKKGPKRPDRPERTLANSRA